MSRIEYHNVCSKLRVWLQVGYSQSGDDVVRGVYSAQCMLYSGYGILSVCSTRWLLYLVYAVLCVNSWSRHREIERDDLSRYCCVPNVLRMGRIEMRTDGANHHEKLRLIYSFVWVDLPWLVWQVQVPIRHVITPIRSRFNPIRQVVLLICHMCS